MPELSIPQLVGIYISHSCFGFWVLCSVFWVLSFVYTLIKLGELKSELDMPFQKAHRCEAKVSAG